MPATATTAPQAVTFVPEPYLPWLRTDPSMQQRVAFESMEKIALPAYEPMSRHFPKGTIVAAVRVTCHEELTEGVYYCERSWEGKIYYDFGRFAGLTYDHNPRQLARRVKEGIAHFDLSTDTKVHAPTQRFCLSEEGISKCHVNFKNSDFKLWRVTHYIDLPAKALNSLGHDSELLIGATEDQKQWLAEEYELLYGQRASEYSAQVLGGFPVPDCWAILRDQQNLDFVRVKGALAKLAPSQARKRKSGAVAITWRSYDCCGKPIGYTDYFKREDAVMLIDFLQNITDLRRAQTRVKASELLLTGEATRIRTEQVLADTLRRSQAEVHQELAHAA